MSGYQTFPGKTGASQSLEKLERLRLPNLLNRKFLDVGCNEGFFCGYALFKNASKVVGLDQEEKFISNAIDAFPKAQFLCSTWDNLPKEVFDVILLASALHYATDQSLLIKKLMSHTALTGTLILEIGVSEKNGDDWIKVKRGIDERYFPTWEKLKNILSPYAWKHVGSSVSQSGDPTPRHVFHIQHLKPTAYLLLSIPGSGKSSICREIFQNPVVTYISGDKLISDIFFKKISRPHHKVEAVVLQAYDDQHLDRVVNKICEECLIEEYFDNCISLSQEKSFAYDGYFPNATHNAISLHLRKRGFIPVLINPQGNFEDHISHQASKVDAREYYKSLRPNILEIQSSNVLFGFIDEITEENNALHCKGWCTSYSSLVAKFFLVKINGLLIKVVDFNRVDRHDVLKKIPTAPLNCGFNFIINLPIDVQDVRIKPIKLYEIFVSSSSLNKDLFLLGMS